VCILAGSPDLVTHQNSQWRGPHHCYVITGTRSNPWREGVVSRRCHRLRYARSEKRRRIAQRGQCSRLSGA